VWFLARDVIYTSRAYAMMPVCLSVRMSVMEVHWRIIANLFLKFRSHFTVHCGCRAACSTAAMLLAVLLAGGSSRAMLASARLSLCNYTQCPKKQRHQTHDTVNKTPPSTAYLTAFNNAQPA